jgi:predicted Zn-ribbon and HTH transcriptional regulator
MTGREQLVCKECGRTFPRPCTRGRRPLRCPDCTAPRPSLPEPLTCFECGGKFVRHRDPRGRPQRCPECTSERERERLRRKVDPREIERTGGQVCSSGCGRMTSNTSSVCRFCLAGA